VSRAGTVELTITARTFEVAWALAGCGPMPTVLFVPPAGFHDWERAEVVRRAHDELQATGLASHGRLAPALAAMFELLGAPRLAVHARLASAPDQSGAPGRSGPRHRAGAGTGPPTRTRGLAAAAGDRAVLATMCGGRLTLRPVAAGRLAHEIVSLLPAHPPGPGSPVSLPRDLLDPAARAAGTSLSSFAQCLTTAGIPAQQAGALVRMIGGTVRRGQFGAELRDAHGRRHAAPRAVAVHDTGAGRYLMVDGTAADGRPWTTVAPATVQLVAGRVRAMVDDLAGAARAVSS
jgi:hypothetical protein